MAMITATGLGSPRAGRLSRACACARGEERGRRCDFRLEHTDWGRAVGGTDRAWFGRARRPLRVNTHSHAWNETLGPKDHANRLPVFPVVREKFDVIGTRFGEPRSRRRQRPPRRPRGGTPETGPPTRPHRHDHRDGGYPPAGSAPSRARACAREEVVGARGEAAPRTGPARHDCREGWVPSGTLVSRGCACARSEEAGVRDESCQRRSSGRSGSRGVLGGASPGGPRLSFRGGAMRRGSGRVG